MNTTTDVDPAQPADKISRAQRWDRVFEVISVIMLGVVAVATAWSGYQAARWGGEQSTLYSRAGALRTESVRASNEALIGIVIDSSLFTQWINAQAAGNQDLAEYYAAGFQEEFRAAFDAWLAADPFSNPDDLSSPFEMAEYTVTSMSKASALEKDAKEAFDLGQAANEQADVYVLTTVILASVLFFVGIASGFDWLPVQIAVTVIGFTLLVWGLYNLAIYSVI